MSAPTVVYITAELGLAFLIAITNALVIWVFISRKQIRTPTNTYIFSLAITDFLAGSVGIPLTVFSVLTRSPHGFDACLFVHLILCVLCTISTFQLLAIAIDKYVTICWRCQMMLDEKARHSRARVFIIIAWISGATIGLLPMFDVFDFASSNYHKFNGQCEFTKVVDYRYLVYVIFFATILIPVLIIIWCYIAIYRRIKKEEKSVKSLLRASERRRRMRNRRKLIRTLFMLVCIYVLCWCPLYSLNTYDFFFPGTRKSVIPTLATVVLSHVNCAINPLIYAFGLPGFKQTLRRFFGIRSATVKIPGGGMTSHLPATSQRLRESGVVRSYIVDCTRKNSKSPSSICHMGQSVDSVETFLTPVCDSYRRQLQPIHESSISFFENNGSALEKPI
ncbi:G-PROTEIN-RECEP-F1-2 domain-containing protein [Aphelenchoides bicaudatus]|nr:G-PROTEIN-RECEP-F1-2 domain-containing protein [Aphelenchoides bicaudatus]